MSMLPSHLHQLLETPADRQEMKVDETNHTLSSTRRCGPVRPRHMGPALFFEMACQTSCYWRWTDLPEGRPLSALFARGLGPMGRVAHWSAAPFHVGRGVAVMGSRRHNPRRAKRHFSYTLAEVAELYGVHRQTVRNWLKSGLKQLDSGRPALFHGEELNRFHDERRAARRRKCGPRELYCFGCKEPREPAGSMLDYLPGTGKTGVVVGICPECDSLMRQNIGKDRLAQLKTNLEVTISPGPEPMEDSSEARSNCHLMKRPAG
jgi:hypothetical protein